MAPASARSRSSLWTLLATEWRNGRPAEDDDSTGWHLAGSSAASVSSSVTGPPSAVAAASHGPSPPERAAVSKRMLFTEDSPSDYEEDDDEVDPLSMHYTAVDDASHKLIAFDQLKKMIESSCACRANT